MKDPELGDNKHGVAQLYLGKRENGWKKKLLGAYPVLFLMTVMLVIGFWAFRCGASAQTFAPGDIVLDIRFDAPETFAHLARRGDCPDETSYDSSADAVSATGTMGTSDYPQGGITVPISTQTAFTTLYSVLTTTSVTSTTTATTLVTVPSLPASTEEVDEDCSVSMTTVSVFVTVVPTTLDMTDDCSTMDDATVTGGGSTQTNVEVDYSVTTGLPDATVPGNPVTLTDVQTDVSYTSGLPDATVSGNPLTLTDVQTEVSYTSGLPDATVSGNPLTLTDVQTELSYTTGLPDATVSGNPSTRTNVRTDLSYTTGLPDATETGDPRTVTTVDKYLSLTTDLPDATASGDPSTVTSVLTSISLPFSSTTGNTVVVISDLWKPWTQTQELTTITAVSTATKTIVTLYSTMRTVVVTEPYYPLSPSTTFAAGTSDVEYASEVDGASTSMNYLTPTSTLTEVVTTTGGPPAISTATVLVSGAPYPSSNATFYYHHSGTLGSPSPSTTLVEVSGGNKKPEPRGMGLGGGTSNIGCTVMLITVFMLLL